MPITENDSYVALAPAGICLVVIAPRKDDSLSCSLWTVSDCIKRPFPHVDERTCIGFYLTANE